MDGSTSSNHTFYYLPQVITFQRRILCCGVRELILQALAPRGENSTAACKVLPSGADLAGLLSPQSYGKPEFIGLKNRRYGKHPDAIINHYRELLDSTQDATQWVAIYSGTTEFMKYMGHNKLYISDEPLHAM
jgi:hypothetical protein